MKWTVKTDCCQASLSGQAPLSGLFKAAGVQPRGRSTRALESGPHRLRLMRTCRPEWNADGTLGVSKKKGFNLVFRWAATPTWVPILRHRPVGPGHGQLGAGRDPSSRGIPPAKQESDTAMRTASKWSTAVRMDACSTAARGPCTSTAACSTATRASWTSLSGRRGASISLSRTTSQLDRLHQDSRAVYGPVEPGARTERLSTWATSPTGTVAASNGIRRIGVSSATTRPTEISRSRAPRAVALAGSLTTPSFAGDALMANLAESRFVSAEPSRRDFLRRRPAPASRPPSRHPGLCACETRSANERLGVGFIGVGGRAGHTSISSIS